MHAFPSVVEKHVKHDYAGNIFYIVVVYEENDELNTRNSFRAMLTFGPATDRGIGFFGKREDSLDDAMTALLKEIGKLVLEAFPQMSASYDWQTDEEGYDEVDRGWVHNRLLEAVENAGNQRNSDVQGRMPLTLGA